MTDYDIAIIGGGFAGLYAAWRLAHDGVRVVLVEASDHLGGTLWSWDWRGFLVDPGTHNFDLRSPIGASFYEDILRENISITDSHDWASTTDRTWTNGFEMPDFGDDDPVLCETALREMRELRATQDPSDDGQDELGYQAWLVARFGPTLAARFGPMVEKVIGGSLKQLDAEASTSLGMFARPKLGSDAAMAELKGSDRFWDDRLGVTLNHRDIRFAGRSAVKRFGYPKAGALRAFCTAASERLKELGVEVLLQTKVKAFEYETNSVALHTDDGHLRASRAFWTLPDHGLLSMLGVDIDLRSIAHPVGCAFYAYEVDSDDIKGPDYLHDFSSERRPYRYNSCGLYSGQVREDGKTFVMAEVPGHPSTLQDLMQPEVGAEVWNDLLASGFVRSGAQPYAEGRWSYPVAFTLPRIGWRKPLEAAQTAMREQAPRIATVAFGHRGRHAFMNHYDQVLQHELKA